MTIEMVTIITAVSFFGFVGKMLQLFVYEGIKGQEVQSSPVGILSVLFLALWLYPETLEGFQEGVNLGFSVVFVAVILGTVLILFGALVGRLIGVSS